MFRCCRKKVADYDAEAWGEWMGAWKAEAGQVDVEQDRLSRAHASFGGETLARMKDLNVLVLGCRGVGVETAKNLILSNVGSVTVWDPTPARVEDRGTNFYLADASVGRSRASESLAQLKSLNPYCKVEALKASEEELGKALIQTNVLSTGRGYSTVVVTQLLPRRLLVALNEQARSRGIAFIMALNVGGVSASLFSDFGPRFNINDEDGEPTQMIAIAGAAVVKAGGIVRVEGVKEGERVVVLALASEHGLQDGDAVVLDDMRGSLESYNGRELRVRRLRIMSPSEAKVDLKDVSVKEMLKRPTQEVLDNFEKQHEHYKSLYNAKPDADKGKFAVREITLFDRLVLVLDSKSKPDSWSAYQSGGLVNSVKKTVAKEHACLEKSLVYTPNPQMMDQEASFEGLGCWIQVALAAALRFQEQHGRWPKLLDDADAQKFVALATALSEERRSLEGACWLQKISFGFPSGEPCENPEAFTARLRRFALLFEAELTGFCAFLGGVAAQEVIKKTGKFTPLEQWLHHDDACLLPDSEKVPAGISSLGRYGGTRYAYQVAVLGQESMDAVRKQRVFLVGCGALGCEYLKGLALMGACTAQGGKVIVTDMDNIEVSNLSRQFLFRQADVGSAKSTTAARVVKEWNPELCIEALEKGVGTTSEDYFDDAFWSSLDLCWNALDNVVARKYTDRCCLWYGLPLLESGTLGTKSNSDVFLPGLTKSYNDGTESDSSETQIAMCTLRSFPYLPLHCIEFAKQAYFADYMEFAPQQYESFRKSPADFFDQLEAMGDGEKLKALKMIKNFIEFQKAGQVDFKTCIRFAFEQYFRDFVISIRDLVHACDEIERISGRPFWTGTKRRPREAAWDAQSPPAEALEYLYAAANCYAHVWKVPHVRNRDKFQRLVVELNMWAPAYSPPANVNCAPQTEEDAGADKGDPVAVEALKAELAKVNVTTLKPCEAHEFEKDDDTNFHVDFLTVATNLRAANYDIKRSERSHVKVTAGRIIPALATTTAMICGLVDVEFLKLARLQHKGEAPLDKFYNANVNLATGSQAINVFRPEPALKRETKLASMPSYTSWDKVDIKGDISLKDVVAEIERRFDAKVLRLFPGGDDKVCLYDSKQVDKISWKIELEDGGSRLVAEPEAQVFAAWPQLRMASQMLQKLPAGGARQNFENQVRAAMASLQGVKDSFSGRFAGPLSAAYAEVARPPAEEREKRDYFDRVFARRTYISLQAHVCNRDGEEADLPLIRYTFR